MTTPPAPAQSDVIRPEFIEVMRHEIYANARKGDWTKFRIGRTEAEAWLGEHVSKLIAAIATMDREAVREHAADVANIAMKIDECFGAAQPTPEQADTPRTDAQPLVKIYDRAGMPYGSELVSPDFARTLERELAAKEAEVQVWQKRYYDVADCITRESFGVEDLCKQATQIRQERDQLRAEVERLMETERHYCGSVKVRDDEILALRAELAAAKEDAERLASAAEEVLRSYIIGKRVEAGHPCPENLVICRELRAAIDAAREDSK